MAISLGILVLSQVAYWLTVRVGDTFRFPSYPFYAGSDGLDAIAAGYVGLVVLTGFAAWMGTELLLIRRGSSRAWARGAAAAAIGVALAGSMLGAAAGFLLDFSAVPSLIVIAVGLLGSAVIMMILVSPSARERREVFQREREEYVRANGLAGADDR